MPFLLFLLFRFHFTSLLCRHSTTNFNPICNEWFFSVYYLKFPAKYTPSAQMLGSIFVLHNHLLIISDYFHKWSMSIYKHNLEISRKCRPVNRPRVSNFFLLLVVATGYMVVEPTNTAIRIQIRN